MPANQRQQTTQSPASPTSQPTAKYTNKDGSKFITVPKVFNPSDSSETSPTMAQTTTKPNGQAPSAPANANESAPAVNRKKQKRRQKQAAKLAAEQPPKSQANGAKAPGKSHFQEHALDGNYEDDGQFDPAEGEVNYSDYEGDQFSGSYGHEGSSANGHAIPASDHSGKKSKKKKKAKSQSGSLHRGHSGTNGISHNDESLPLPLSSADMPRGPGISKEKIWNTSSAEERQRIKDFWLSLGNDERKSLVKIEKDAVLKKMKEQQKHSCSCTVCGRKRTAIEEELEVLYDAYYEELEQYANHQGDGGPTPMMPPPRRFGPMSGLQPPNRLPPVFNGQQPSRGRIVEQLGDDDDEEGDEEYSDEDGDEDDYSDEEPEEVPRINHATDFFSFGNNLTVQGGILTVADDLLKNDGKKFIEMMEQLAERRMAREEDARAYANQNYGHPPNGAMHPPHTHTHNHPPQDDEEYDDEDDEEDEYDSQDEDYDEEEMVGDRQCGCDACSNFMQDTMTEEQRMEEGRRMFQIFAARMFEQRVLTAYKEKVAKERQQKLLEELEEENLADSQKKAKKAKDAQRKKEKQAEKKKAAAEEKAKLEAKKAAEEAAIRAAEEKKAEEHRLKAEEKRRKREAQKKAEEEERLRKEAEKQRRLQEQRDRQAELERKQREAKEKERKEKEEQRQKEREAKEAKDREARERKEKQERDKREKEARVKAEKESKEKQKREELAAQAAIAATQSSKRPQPPVPIPGNLQSHSSSIASPRVPVATPAIPKAPTPIKLRTASQQESNGSVPQTPQSGGLSQNTSPHSSTPLDISPGPIGPPGKNQGQQPLLHHPQATSPMHAALKSPPGIQPNTFAGMQPMGLGFQQPGMPMMGPGFGGRMQQHDPMFAHQPQMGGQFRPPLGPNGMAMHPPFGMPPMHPGRGFPLQHGPPGFPPQMPGGLGGIGQPIGAQKDGPPSQSHSRQQSGSYEKPFDAPTSVPQAQPIARPAPIGRPSSVVHGHRDAGVNDIDDLSNRLGSRALLDESDEPLDLGADVRRSSALNINTRPGFAPPFGMEHGHGFPSPISSFNTGTWGAAPPIPFSGPSSMPGSNYNGWGPSGGNGSFGAVRPPQPRSVAVRLMICRACQNLEGSTPDGFYDVNLIKEQIEHLNPPGEQPVSEKELLQICETEGNNMNGGGSFEIRNDANGQSYIRHENDTPSAHRPIGAPGEIGSPVVGGGGMARFAPGPPPGFN